MKPARSHTGSLRDSQRILSLGIIAFSLALAYGIWYAYSVILVALLREYGQEAYWREKGWPTLCRPLGADDFECGDFAASTSTKAP